MKRVVLFLLVLTFCLSGVSASVYDETTKSISYNGILSDGTSIYEEKYVEPESTRESAISPQVLIGYEYVDGYEEIRNRQIEYYYAYLWGTSVKFSEGVSPSYKITTRRQVTKETSWELSGTAEASFDIKAVKTKLLASGNYKSTNTAVLEVGEEWDCEFTEPKLYNLTWYMRGHKYNAYCGAKYISTDGNDGKFTLLYIGDVIFPTEEVHLEISSE